MAQIDLRPLEERTPPSRWSFRACRIAAIRPFLYAHYASFSPRPYVAKVLLTKADRDGVMRQRICPVSGVPLGSRGPIAKLYIADFLLYVAGDDCIAAVKEAPQRFLPQPSLPSPGR